MTINNQNFHLSPRGKKFANIRLLLITNFITPTNDSNVDVIVKTIQDTNLELVAISDCIEHTPQTGISQFSQNQIQSSTQMSSQQLFNNVIDQVGGYLCHIDHAEAQLLTFQKKTSRAMPWNSQLTIGSNLKINISAYVSIQEEKFLAPFKTDSTDENTVTKVVTEYEQNNQLIDKPSVDDVISAYMYGSTRVALEKEPDLKDTEKCLSCLGFSKRELVLNGHLAGEGCHVVLPQKNYLKSAKLFASLVTAMHQSGRVMIARKVYMNKHRPTIVVLIPDFLDKIPYFRMIQLPFANDFTLYSFPRLRTKKSESSKEQERVVQELVNAMDLMNAIDDDSGITEAFSLEKTLNPVNQHLCRSVAFRALNPSSPLPTFDPELAAMIDVPPKVKKACENIIKELEEQFPLELVERRVKKIFGKSNTDSMLVDDSTDVDADAVDESKNVVAIGTVTPVEDFGVLLKKGVHYGTLADQIQSVIYDLIFRTTSAQTEKILECILFYREQSKLYAPFNYNNWIKELKKVIIERNRLDFWQDAIVKEGFGLITSDEAPISAVNAAEQKEFYEITSKDTFQTNPMDQGDDDLDALLD